VFLMKAVNHWLNLICMKLSYWNLLIFSLKLQGLAVGLMVLSFEGCCRTKVLTTFEFEINFLHFFTIARHFVRNLLFKFRSY
jgi:hypothetical protein